MGYNILVLHGNGIYRVPPVSVINHTHFLERYAPDNHNFMYHRWDLPVTSALRRTTFHVIILATTALRICRHRPREHYYRIRDAWSFLGDSDAVKLAFPQDDYHATNVLDMLFTGLGVDVVYSVLPNHMHMLYPKSSRHAKLESVLTGYVDDATIKSTEPLRRKFEDRTFDVFYRGTHYPYYGGYFARIKGDMAHRVRDAALAAGLRVDISTRSEDRLTDGRWFEALGNSRFSLGCESGVSLWDPDGEYVESVKSYVNRHKSASFRMVEKACFPDADGKHIFSAVSPRLFESAMMGCSQVLVQGTYLGILRPWEHYIPVRRDLSDVSSAVEAMMDSPEAKRRAESCYEILVESGRFRYSTLAEKVMQDIYTIAKGRGFRPMEPRQFRHVELDHEFELKAMNTWHSCRTFADFETA